MADLPYFPFYPADWLSDPKVLALGWEERGVYVHLLSLMWTYSSDRCALPNDDKILARMLGMPLRKWRAMRPFLVHESVQKSSPINAPLSCTEDGLWVVSGRLVAEWERARAKSQKAASSAASRWSGSQKSPSDRSANEYANALPTQSDRSADADADAMLPIEPEPEPEPEPNAETKNHGSASLANARSQNHGRRRSLRSLDATPRGAPRSNSEIVGGLIDHATRAIGRPLTGQERGILAHCYTEYGLAQVTHAIGELAAECDRGRPPKEPATYLVAILQGRGRDNAPRRRVSAFPNAIALGYGDPDPPPG